MDMTVSSIRPNRVEVVINVQRRRRWTPEQKLEIVKQTNEPGSPVSLVARQHGLTAVQLFQWRKAYLEGSLNAVGTNKTVVQASELQEAMRRIKQLEGALGRKTLENEILKEAVDFAKAKKWIVLMFIQSGKPNQNAFVERFNRSFRDEVLNANLFNSVDQAQEAADDWVQDYNEFRPHESLGDVAPIEFIPRKFVKEISSFELST
jgi:transposase